MLYIVLGFVMVFWAWMQAAMGQLQKYKKEARAQWVRVDALLKTRAEYVLELLTLAHESGLESEDLFTEIYDLEGGYCASSDREVVCACAENVTPLIDRLLELLVGWQPLEENERYREIRTGLADLEEEIEVQSERYNHHIDLYNRHREKPTLRPQMVILGAIPLKGLHLRTGEKN